MANIILDSFPFDSMEVLNEESGQMEEDRLYEAKIYRKYFQKFLTNGVYYGDYNNYKENSMKVLLDGGMNIRVLKGAGMINGADFENTEEREITLERPVTGSRIDRVIIQLDDSLEQRNTKLYIKQGTAESGAELQRDNNIYEICIAEIIVRATSNIQESDITDTRLNKELCGIVNSLIAVDGEELYQRFQAYIDTVTDELVRKDQDAVMTGTITDTEGRSFSKNDFTDEYKTKLDGLERTEVENVLTSTSTTKALSAAMGKKLNDEKQKKITWGTAAPTGGADGDLYDQVF